MKTFSLLMLALLMLSMSAYSKTYHYVKHDASGNNDGTSWADAFTGLQHALTAASSGDEIWVAAGAYTPITEVGGTGDRFKAFQLKNGVSVYGGFAGNEDPVTFDLDDRDFDLNETIMSGDLGGGVHVYHVFRHVNLSLDATAVLDGFTITAGKADGTEAIDQRGGGMLNDYTTGSSGSSPTIRNCVFKNNEATEGGAMYNSRYSSPVISNTTFSNNTASARGGAVFNTRNTPQFTNCVFISNQATGSDQNDGGGAMYNITQHQDEGPIIDQCSFTSNMVPVTGTNTYGGGAIFGSINPGKLHISNSQFIGNTGRYGGAIYHSSGSDNNRDASDVKISNSTFELNTAEYGGGIFSDRHNTTVTSCIIRGNEATEQSGGFYGRNASSKLINTLVSGNKSGKHGGGVYFNDESPEVINSTLTGNYSGERGGGISLIGTSTLTFNNSILYGNASPEGNELWVCATCIANIDHSLYGDATNDVFITNGGSANATNSLNSDPEFFNPVTATDSETPNTSGIYMIQSISPAVDAGLNSHLDASVTHDLRGGPRLVDGNNDNTATIDMGAYEYNPTCSSNPPISGRGTETDPYIIAEPGNFCWMAQNQAEWNKHFKQIVDIDLTGSENLDGGQGLRPIGNSTTKFTGTYDGQGYNIINLVINRPGANDVGLFGVIDGKSTQKVVLQNITLVNVNINGNRNVGALVGLADQWNDITNCHVSGTVKGNRDAGGLVGWGRRTDFLRCSSSADVSMITPTGAIYHGGLIGHINQASTVKESFATGDISGRARVGGLIGAVGWNSQVENCYARGNVQSDIADPMMGGLIGEVFNAGVRYSYSTGHINMTGVTSDYGGLVGNKTTTSNFFDTDNFWDTETSGLSTSEMGTGKTTTEMQTQGTFTNWDFATIWEINPSVNDGYPSFSFNLFTWNGSVNTDWGNADNWNPAQIPVTGNSVLIPGSLINYPIVDGARSVGDLTISAGASLTIPAEKSLTVNGTLLNNSGNAGLLIQSDASGTGSLIHSTDDVAGTVERYIPASGYHLVSVPVTQASNPVSGWFLWSYLFEFDAISQQWIAMGAQTGKPLNVNQGYMIYKYPGPAKWQSDTTYAFEGALNNAAFSADVSHVGTATYTFNLVPNPYPSAIDWNAASGWTKTNLAGSYWMWRHTHNNYGVWNGTTGTNDVTKDIPVGQAFFVQATAANPVLAMNNGVRLHSTQAFYKDGEEISNLLRLNVSSGEYSDEIVVMFDGQAQAGYDPMEDAAKMFGGADAPQLYTLSADGHKLTINMLPLNDEKMEIPLLLEQELAGEVNFEASSLQSFDPDVTIHLWDRLTGTMSDLREKPGYAFSHHPDNPAHSFDLIFNSAVGIDEMESLQAQAYFHDGSLLLHIPEEITGLTTVHLYNVSGQRVFAGSVNPGRSSISLPGLSSGVYMIQMINAQGVVTRKALYQ